MQHPQRADILQKYAHRLAPNVLWLLDQPHLEQRTPAWFEARTRRVTASEVGTILRVSDAFTRPVPLFYQKVTGDYFPGHKPGAFAQQAMDRGTRLEAEAVRHFLAVTGLETVLDFGLISHPEHWFVAASPDGVLIDGSLLEIKCPTTYTEELKPPKKQYWCQMQWQMETCNAEQCYFFQYFPEGTEFVNSYRKREKLTETKHHLQIISRDRVWFQSVFSDVENFMNDVLACQEDRENARTLGPYFSGVEKIQLQDALFGDVFGEVQPIIPTFVSKETRPVFRK